MSTYPQQPVYTPQQTTVRTPDGTYYQTAANGQMVYAYDPKAAIQDRAVVPTAPSTVTTWFDFSNPNYIKGLLVGAGATLLVTNPTVQNAVVKGAVAAWSAVVGGIEEVKERIRDAKAERSMT
ncbi:MAG: hypothetical protein CR984_05470 [Proteobacteria bacterium]|nr:MAG: hypothetical protein CR984_05470 [Pseudomonadota bacterium]